MAQVQTGLSEQFKKGVEIMAEAVIKKYLQKRRLLTSNDIANKVADKKNIDNEEAQKTVNRVLQRMERQGSIDFYDEGLSFSPSEIALDQSKHRHPVPVNSEQTIENIYDEHHNINAKHLPDESEINLNVYEDEQNQYFIGYVDAGQQTIKLSPFYEESDYAFEKMDEFIDKEITPYLDEEIDQEIDRNQEKSPPLRREKELELN